MEEPKKDHYFVDSSSLFGSTNLDDSSIRTELQLDQNKDVRPSQTHRSIRLLAFILICIVVPVALYFALRREHSYTYTAMHLSGLVPVTIIIHRTIFERNMDILGVLILAEFVASMVVLLLPGDALEVMSRKAWLAIGNAIVLLLTMIPSQYMRPLLYFAFRDIMRIVKLIFPSDGRYPVDRIAWAWNNLRSYRNCIRSLTIMWMLIFLVTGAVRLGLIYKSTLPQDSLLHTLMLISDVPLGIGIFLTVLIGGIGMRVLVSKRLSEHNIVRNTSDV
ncbi:hypothetical protein BC943DRAFT_361055 [Umbelopsis sp. AD052]|nr:hypothetical protein BC943DRAFT_361055 [Umbelopsis sp. AD052]